MSVKQGFSRKTVFKNIAKRVRSMGKAITGAFGGPKKSCKKRVCKPKKKR